MTDPGRTFAQLQQEVLAHGFGAPRYQSRIKVWLNQAVGQIARHANLAGLEQTVTITTQIGVATYEIPGDVVRIMSLSDRGFQLRNVDVSEVDASFGELGAPTGYATFGSKVLLTPTPLSARDLEIRVRARPSVMAADEDTPNLPLAYEDVILSYALWHAFRSEDDVEMATFYQGQYEQGMAQLRTDLQYPDESRHRQIPGMLAGRDAPSFRFPE